MKTRAAVAFEAGRPLEIVEVDLDNLVARVQPGVRNLAISEAVAEHGLYYAPDPSSQIACSIGGNVAENSGGVHCLKYGLTVHNVVGVRLATVDGEVLELGGKVPEGPGYDLLALVMGSEGMLGVVTEVTVRLLPSPPEKRVLLAPFADVGAAADAVGAIIAEGKFGVITNVRSEGTEDIKVQNMIVQELEQVRRKNYDKDAKVQMIGKDDVKTAIGRSPDYSDALMMRLWYEIKSDGKYFVH